MFHVKHRKLGVIAGLSLLGILAVGCGSGAASSRGWAEPVESGNIVHVSTGKGRIDAINTQTNIRTWRFPDYWDPQDGDDLSGIYGAPVLSADGDTVFVADYNGFVYAFKQSQVLSESQLQTDAARPVAASLDLGEPIIGGIAIDTANSDLFASSGGRMLRLRYASDRLVEDWVFQ